jgi:DNA-binding CsgD family transcriptional regulator
MSAVQHAELTDLERRVARLVAWGGSTRDVAEALGIDATAVERHLERVYLKLGTRSRGATRSPSESLAGQWKLAPMRSYLVELQLPEGGAVALAAAGERARSAAEQLACEGTAVRWVRSIYVQEDDRCLLVMEAPSPEAVGEASRRAALEYERIVERTEQ